MPNTARLGFLSRILCHSAGADAALLGQATPHSRWQLATLGVLLWLAVPLNSAGFYCLLAEATGWDSQLWFVQIAAADILAAIIFVMDARGIAAATYALGWNQARERGLFGRAATSPPPSSTLPVIVRISFSVIMNFAATGGLLLGALHSDVDASRRQSFWAANSEAQKAATAIVERNLDDAKGRKKNAAQDLERLDENGTAVDGVHPFVLEFRVLRKKVAEDGAKLAQLEEAKTRAQFLRNCEDSGGNLPGCTGNRGKKRAYNAADSEVNSATNDIAILQPGFVEAKNKLAAIERALKSLRENADRRLIQARADEQAWESRGYGKEYRELVEAQGSFKPGGTSLISQVAAFIALLKSEPTAASVVSIILALATLALDLVNLFGARAWTVPHDFAVAVVLRTERAMHQLGNEFQANHHELLRARDIREKEAIDFGKRERQRQFDEANAEAATRAALQTVRDEWRAPTTH